MKRPGIERQGSNDQPIGDPILPVEDAVRAVQHSNTFRRTDMNTQASQLFATCLCAFRECSDSVQAMIVEMAAIANDPEATPDEREAAVATIAEALFPSGGSGSLGVDLEAPGGLDDEGADKDILDALDAEEEAFSERLAALLREKQVTQLQLAECIGVGQPAISMMLSRKCRPQRRTVERIATALGVTPADLWPSHPQAGAPG